MSDLPPIITAEAAVKSKRSGFVSIFDPQTDITKIANIKQFYADPLLMREAAVELKKAGFKVIGSDRVSLTIIAPIELFEQQFNVAIISTEQGLTCKGGTQIGYINTDNSAFSGVLAGIALAQETIMNGADPPKKQDENYQLYPWQVPVELGTMKTPEEYLLFTEDKTPVRVAVIDTGFQFDHPYFTADDNKQLGNVKLKVTSTDRSRVEPLLQSFVIRINHLLDVAEDIKNLPGGTPQTTRDEKIKSLLLSLDELLPGSRQELPNANPKLEEVIALLRKIETAYIDSIEAERAVERNLDYHGHGTQVTSVLLAFINRMQVELEVCKKAAGSNTDWFISCFKTVLANNPDIITCTHTHRVNASDSPLSIGNSPAILRAYYYLIKESAERGVTFIFSAGNGLPNIKQDTFSWEAQLPFVITVGGAHKKLNSPNTIVASDCSQGYSLTPGSQAQGANVPDVCGLNGKADSPMFILPSTGESWVSVNGTSYAAPQIAGICAFIKKVHPAADWKEMREILVRTSDVIAEGKSSNGVEMRDLKNTLADGTMRGIGLANIDEAIALAKIQAAHAANLQSLKAIKKT